MDIVSRWVCLSFCLLILLAITLILLCFFSLVFSLQSSKTCILLEALTAYTHACILLLLLPNDWSHEYEYKTCRYDTATHIYCYIIKGLWKCGYEKFESQFEWQCPWHAVDGTSWRWKLQCNVTGATRITGRVDPQPDFSGRKFSLKKSLVASLASFS